MEALVIALIAEIIRVIQAIYGDDAVAAEDRLQKARKRLDILESAYRDLREKQEARIAEVSRRAKPDPGWP